MAIASALAGLVCFTSGKVLVRACQECNSVAGAKFFKSIGAKRRYVQARMKRRYARYLRMPDWSEADIGELGWELQQRVRRGLSIRDQTRRRVAWRNVLNVRVTFRPNDIGSGFAQSSAEPISI